MYDSIYEAATALEEGAQSAISSGLQGAAEGVVGAVTSNFSGFAGALAQDAGLVPPGTIQTPLNALGNVLKNFGVLAIAVLIILVGGAMISLSWGEDIADSLERIADKIPVAAIE